MKVLIVGGGGREHAIATALNKSSKVDKIYCAPGNAGIAEIATCVPIGVMEFDKLTEYAVNEGIDLTIVAPDDPLVAGAVDAFDMNMVWGFIPGSVGETSVIAIALGALLLLYTGIASWKTMLSVFVGGALTAVLYNKVGPDNAMAAMPWYQHLVVGGFCFGAVFMATDPVTSCRTEGGKWIYGLLIGFMAITIRVMNPGFPEGMMLAILLLNCFAPLIDYCFVQANVNKRVKRINK